MTLVVVGSVAGAPGATRFALGLTAAWPDHGQRRVVVEADPDGGRLGAELGIGVEPGLMDLAIASRTAGLTADDLVERGAAAIADWYVIPAPPSSEQTHSALVHAGGALGAVMSRADDSGPLWVIDAGRLSTRSPSLPFATSADHVVIVTAGSFPLLQLVAHRIDSLRTAGCAVSVAVVEPTLWGVDEIADFVGADVLAVLPLVKGGRDDGITAMNGTSWRAWWRRVSDAATYLASTGHRAAAEEVTR
jgi:MinD-like ATPase involved in chromosome partitioning or flagellar assembly